MGEGALRHPTRCHLQQASLPSAQLAFRPFALKLRPLPHPCAPDAVLPGGRHLLAAPSLLPGGKAFPVPSVPPGSAGIEPLPSDAASSHTLVSPGNQCRRFSFPPRGVCLTAFPAMVLTEQQPGSARLSVSPNLAGTWVSGSELDRSTVTGGWVGRGRGRDAAASRGSPLSSVVETALPGPGCSPACGPRCSPSLWAPWGVFPSGVAPGAPR